MIEVRAHAQFFYLKDPFLGPDEAMKRHQARKVRLDIRTLPTLTDLVIAAAPEPGWAYAIVDIRDWQLWTTEEGDAEWRQYGAEIDTRTIWVGTVTTVASALANEAERFTTVRAHLYNFRAAGVETVVKLSDGTYRAFWPGNACVPPSEVTV